MGHDPLPNTPPLSQDSSEISSLRCRSGRNDESGVAMESVEIQLFIIHY